jgi:hypothetical protein
MNTQWTTLCKKSDAFSIDVYESTDVADKAQLAIFIRGVDSNFNATEKLAALNSMKESVTRLQNKS